MVAMNVVGVGSVARYRIAVYANIDICAGECVAAVLVEKDVQEKVNLGINFEVCVRTQLSPCRYRKRDVQTVVDKPARYRTVRA